ncbi:MAG: cell division protein FtsQ/DivIB [Pikeienuella sp.]
MRSLAEILRLKGDPAPSKFWFRVNRMGRGKLFRRVVLVWLPITVVAASVAWLSGRVDVRDAVAGHYSTAMDYLAERPEFAVRRVAVVGAEGEVAAQIEAQLRPWLGGSSLRLDTAQLRTEIAALGWVEHAQVRLTASETLEATVVLRKPAAVWRQGEMLSLIDRQGAVISPLDTRAARADLPLVAGVGANEKAALTDALAIQDAAAGLAHRLRGLVRVGERRWDAVLQDGPRVLLPAEGAVEAMGYLVALQNGEDVVERDVSLIDLRIAGRPTLRLGPDAHDYLYELRQPKAEEEDA